VEVVVEFALVDELGMFGVDWFHLDCHFQVGLGVYGLVDFAECTLVDLADDLEVFAHFLQHLRHRENNYFKS